MLTAYIADDEVWITLGLKKLLQRSGEDVEVVGTANNGLTAREEIAARKPDLVFTDIRMPGLTGLELLREMGKISPDSLVVIISGYAEFEYAREAVEYHAFDYLLKPIKEEELARVLGNVKQHREMTAPTDEGERAGGVHGRTGSSPEEDSADGGAPGREDSGESGRPRGDRTIDRVVAEMRRHFTEDISLTALAEKYNMSTGRLSSMIKEELQMTYSDYIASLRIQRAKELLRDESLSIQEIAEQVGYNDYFYFTKVFKKAQGISPSKYRKSL